VKTLKIPICKFGKGLDIKEIILGVMYIKGNKNDVGDGADDYVEIIIKEKEN